MKKIPVLCFMFLMMFTLTFSLSSLKDINKAVSSNNISRLKELLNDKFNPDERDSYGGTALHAAMFQTQNPEIIELMIDEGYDLNAVGPRNGYTPLHDAVWANNEIALEILLKKGAKTNIRGKDNLTPYEKAKKEGKENLIEIFERNGIKN